MILVDNVIYLKKNYPKVWETLTSIEKHDKHEKWITIVTKSGLPTLFLEEEGKQVYLHSKYDPINEAEQWIRPYEEEVKQKDSIFFYGFGFGFHIECLMKKFPDKTFTIYEPNPYIFYQYLCQRKIEVLPLNKLQSLVIDSELLNKETFISEYLEQNSNEFTFLIHPIYERIFEQSTRNFLNVFQRIQLDKKASMNFNTASKNLWTLNCSRNFLKVLETPNVLREMKNIFKDKPVVLVAAGPSLAEEIENIRYIKEHGLAYIIAVGSANKALISHGIYPDAITTFDPFDHNYLVFDEIIQQGINNIPLIFGTSVGFKTVQLYPGQMLHMVTNKDFISAYYLQKEDLDKNNEIIANASTISVITLDLLYKLGCEFVILVGQNFAFRDEQRYSKGIEYEYRTNKIRALEIADLEFVLSVDGKEITTMKGFTHGRLAMELLIKEKSNMAVWNTTKGGAQIAGTEFMDLGQMIHNKLKNSVVEKNWNKREKTHYSKANILNQTVEMEKEFKKITTLLLDFSKTLKKIKQLSLFQQQNQLNRPNNEIVRLMHKLDNNDFYNIYIKIGLEFEKGVLDKTLESIKYSKDLPKKISVFIHAYSQYIIEVQLAYENCKPLYSELQQFLFNYTNTP